MRTTKERYGYDGCVLTDEDFEFVDGLIQHADIYVAGDRIQLLAAANVRLSTDEVLTLEKKLRNWKNTGRSWHDGTPRQGFMHVIVGILEERYRGAGSCQPSASE